MNSERRESQVLGDLCHPVHMISSFLIFFSLLFLVRGTRESHFPVSILVILLPEQKIRKYEEFVMGWCYEYPIERQKWSDNSHQKILSDCKEWKFQYINPKFFPANTPQEFFVVGDWKDQQREEKNVLSGAMEMWMLNASSGKSIIYLRSDWEDNKTALEIKSPHIACTRHHQTRYNHFEKDRKSIINFMSYRNCPIAINMYFLMLN